MSDDLNIRAPQDPKKININESWEVRYWCKTLGVSEADLRAAVKAAGPMVDDVRRHLQRQR